MVQSTEIHSTDIYAPEPCYGGCGRLVEFPRVTCGSEVCLRRYEDNLDRDDRMRNMVDFCHD